MPRWLRRRRTQALIAAFLGLSLVSTVVLIMAARVGEITHESALGVIGDVVTGGRGSTVAQAVSDGKPVVIALYGYGGDGHDGAYLSDSVMVVVVQPRADAPAQIAEISLPRDWFVPIDLGGGRVVDGKLNEAYAFADDSIYPNRSERYKGEFGRPALADDTVGGLLGIHIDHFVGMDFHAFEYAVDAVGGIDITVARSFVDHDYPNPACDYNTPGCTSETVGFSAGPQHMDGATALQFARSRHGDNGEGSDFARSQRQQLVLAAVREKIGGVGGVSKLFSVLGALQGHVVTDLTAGDAEQLYGLVKNVPGASVEHIGIDDTNFLYDCGYPTNCGSYYLYPHDGSLASLRRFIAHIIPDPAALAEREPISVVDGSGMDAGGSGRWAQLLSELGFKARDGGTVTVRMSSSVIADGAGGTRTAAWLADYFGAAVPPAPTPSTTAAGAPAATPPPSGAPPAATASTSGLTLVLGRDEERSFLRGGGAGDGQGSSPGGSGAGSPTRPRTSPPPAPVRTAPPPAATPPPPSALSTPPPTLAPTPSPTQRGKPSPTPIPGGSPNGNPAPGG